MVGRIQAFDGEPEREFVSSYRSRHDDLFEFTLGNKKAGAVRNKQKNFFFKIVKFVFFLGLGNSTRISLLY